MPFDLLFSLVTYLCGASSSYATRRGGTDPIFQGGNVTRVAPQKRYLYNICQVKCALQLLMYLNVIVAVAAIVIVGRLYIQVGTYKAQAYHFMLLKKNLKYVLDELELLLSTYVHKIYFNMCVQLVALFTCVKCVYKSTQTIKCS